jgi:ketosteroid isomerase-like protein
MSRLCGLLLFVCIESVAQQQSDIDKFINQWHQAATDANAAIFFGAMADDCIYIGTDATERWSKAEFKKFAKPFFDKGKAWDFKPYQRDVHVSADGQYVWFSELLTTWMGVCRGSGILSKTPDGWEIKQYHLSVTVPNDTIKDFLKLIENFNNTRK